MRCVIIFLRCTCWCKYLYVKGSLNSVASYFFYFCYYIDKHLPCEGKDEATTALCSALWGQKCRNVLYSAKIRVDFSYKERRRRNYRHRWIKIGYLWYYWKFLIIWRNSETMSGDMAVIDGARIWLGSNPGSTEKFMLLNFGDREIFFPKY